MKSLDTNVIIRFLVNDDKKQAQAVKSLFLKVEEKQESFFVTSTVMLEMIYVLDSVYDYERAEIIDAIESMLLMKILVFENPEAIGHLVNSGKKTGIELEDLFIGLCAKENNCTTTLTFDRKAARSNLFELIK